MGNTANRILMGATTLYLIIRLYNNLTILQIRIIPTISLIHNIPSNTTIQILLNLLIRAILAMAHSLHPFVELSLQIKVMDTALPLQDHTNRAKPPLKDKPANL